MSQTKTALCHSISYPLTSIYNIPHGIACSLTLAEVAKLNNNKNNKKMQVVANAFDCNNNQIAKTIREFLISIKYKRFCLVVKLQPSKLATRVRFPSPAPKNLGV